MTPNLRARRRLARAATFTGAVLALVSVPLAWGLAAVAGAVLLAVGGVRWLDCNAELMRREGTTRGAGSA